jgi:hypothetical protein
VNNNKIWHSRIKKAEGVDSFELEGSNMVFDSLDGLVSFCLKTKSDLLAPAIGSPFTVLWQRKKNSVGGYKDFHTQTQK